MRVLARQTHAPAVREGEFDSSNTISIPTGWFNDIQGVKPLPTPWTNKRRKPEGTAKAPSDRFTLQPKSGV